MPETITSEQIEARVREALVEFGAEPGEIARDAEFVALDVDSLDLVELAQIAEDEWGVELRTEDMKGLRMVGDAIDLIAQRSG